MSRYFLELSYMGTAYSGFQVQANANSIQAEIEKAFFVYFRQPVNMTGSSRTDTGVHARQNYFHFDFEERISQDAVYRLNAILPGDISIRSIREMPAGAHCRFDAESREYRYYTYGKKDPFLRDRAYYYPYPVDLGQMQEASRRLVKNQDFSSFSKRNTQVKNFLCTVWESEWEREGDCLLYRIRANRFLRGMVRGLTGTLLQVGRGILTIEDFEEIVAGKDRNKVNFNVPAKGLFLVNVRYREGLMC
ncbi:MAG: tRNA pseudouridine(38-40) synthase TruA [Bacteroidota bacterium]|nr:tRNA pseudouridine(38-40) synthase TruA [Bacteroidota bacterium]MDP4251117.1 tRNA pseudouridine(38-40) synthase TruA [Bacteroidota bacterium]